MALKFKDKGKVTRGYTRMVIAGPPGIGKSTAMATIAKKALVLDLNKRFPGALVRKHDFLEFAESYSGVKEALNSVLSETKIDHDFLLLDTVTDLVAIIKAHSVAVDFGGNLSNYSDYSKGDKNFLPNYLKEILVLMDKIADKFKINIGLICHTLPKPQENPLGKNYSKECLDLPDRASATVLQWCDTLGFCHFDVVVQQDGLKMKGKSQSRVISFNDAATHQAKNGSPYAFPDKIPLDLEGAWAEIVFGGTQELLKELDTILAAFPSAQRAIFETAIEEQNVRGMNPAQLKDFIKNGKDALTKIGGK